MSYLYWLAVKLVKDEARKKSKGYAFIQYNSQEAALQALESMDQKVLVLPFLDFGSRV